MATRTIHVLLAEDNLVQARLLEAAVLATGIPWRVHWVVDGHDALLFLRRQERFKGKPRPDLILLDGHMPRLNGWEVLREIKSDDTLRTIPTLLMSSSAEAHDVALAYRDFANAYVPKPPSLNELTNTLRTIHQFWFGAAALPTQVEHHLPYVANECVA